MSVLREGLSAWVRRAGCSHCAIVLPRRNMHYSHNVCSASLKSAQPLASDHAACRLHSSHCAIVLVGALFAVWTLVVRVVGVEWWEPRVVACIREGTRACVCVCVCVCVCRARTLCVCSALRGVMAIPGCGGNQEGHRACVCVCVCVCNFGDKGLCSTWAEGYAMAWQE